MKMVSSTAALLLFLFLVLAGCSGPLGFKKEIEPNKYRIRAYGRDPYVAWDQKSSQVCNGAYRTLETARIVDDSHGPTHVVGTIECL